MSCLTSSVAALGLLLAAAGQSAEPVEVFTHKSQVFMRAGETAGVGVGATVGIFSEPKGKTHKRVRLGSATVAQVWPAQARLNLDAAAKGDKSPKKFALIEAAAKPEAPPPVAAPAPRAPPAPPTPKSLAGHATFTGIGPFKALKLFNEEDRQWTNCSLKLPGNLYYALDHLEAGDHKSIVRGSFEVRGTTAKDVPIDSVEVTCDEGEAKYIFPN